MENKTQINVKPIDRAMTEKLIISLVDNNDYIEPDDQSFQLTIKPKIFYIISGTRESKIRANLHRCGILLFDEGGKVKSVFSTLAPKNDESFWTCDGTEAISFKDHYPDGSLKIIVLYNVTPPSNERFILPVILKFDLKNSSLGIDEDLTRKLKNVDITTIQEFGLS
ncbi:hypothetical protein [Pelotalea chapellei]|uniref:Uncharacterized protein n=1 Tax=Pelotalea chapellei TaxID=44671 RepID=A0ABS5U579_9BACT|nr:hypothetical protein [Pelotalea chapellei]MBT1070828.1 hypothetical protein [Pelotalea chapellei]